MPTPVTPSASRATRNLIIVLVAVGALAALVLAVVLGKSDSADKPGASEAIAGGFHELRADEFADAVLAAREEAGSWSFLEVNTLDGKTKAVWKGEVVWKGGDDFSMTYGADGTEGVFVLADGSWFFHDPQPKMKPWVKLQEAEAGPLIASLTREADPRRQIAIFEDPKEFAVIGVENIGTAVAVHYRITVSIEQVREAAGNVIVGDAGDDQVFDVWLDKEDRLLKLVLPTTIGTLESSEVRTFSYGKDLEIEAPPADQVRLGTVKIEE